MPDDERTDNGPEHDDDSEVLSLGMAGDEKNDETDGGGDEPQLTPADEDAGFDGWLDGADDPYSAGEKGDAAGEVADWLAFARGEGGDSADAVVDQQGTEIGEEDLGEGSWSGDGEPPDGYTIKGNTDSTLYHRPDSWLYDETDAEVWFNSEEAAEAAGFRLSSTHPADDDAEEESPTDVEPGASEEEDEEDEEDDVDTSEFDLVPVTDATGEVAFAVEEAPSMAGETSEDTGEAAAFAGGANFDLEPSAAVSSPVEFDAGEPPPPMDFTEEDLLGAATREHEDLAAAIAAAEGVATEQVPLSATIPGLETGVVGFEDVVEDTGPAEEELQEPDSSDLILRVGTGLALVVVLLLSLLWRPALIVFVLAVLVVSAGEFYSALIHRRFKPMSLFGFLGIAGAGLGTAAWGVGAIPIALAGTATVLLLFNAVSPRRDQPAANFSLTVLVAAWVGGLGAFAFDIIAAEEYQVVVISLVALVALVDIAAYFVGGSIGRRALAPVISPNKTVEGLVAGTLTAFAVGAIIGYLVDPIDLPTGLALGAVVAVFAPLGDLSVSVVKRSLHIKDMGSILPGHGGLLDRLDALIAVIPAAWVVLTWLAVI